MSAGLGHACVAAAVGVLAGVVCFAADWAVRAWRSERRSRRLAEDLEAPLWVGAPSEPLACPASNLFCSGFRGFTADPGKVLAADRYQRCPTCCAVFDHATGQIVGGGGRARP